MSHIFRCPRMFSGSVVQFFSKFRNFVITEKILHFFLDHEGFVIKHPVYINRAQSISLVQLFRLSLLFDKI